jgi:predicted ATPase
MSMGEKESSQKKGIPEISSVSITGFKSIYDEQTIDIKNLTLFAGSNSSGKSSIFQPLLLMKQTFEESYDPGVLLLNGPNAKFNMVEQLFSNIPAKESKKDFQIKFQFSDTIFTSVIFTLDKNKEIQLSEVEYHGGNENFVLKSNMKHNDILTLDPSLSNIYESFKNFLENKENPDKKAIEKLKYFVERNRCLLTIALRTEEMSIRMNISTELAGRIENTISNIIHVPALRGNNKRFYPKPAIGKKFPGTFENYVASIINHWNNSPKKTKLKPLEKELISLNLTEKIKTKKIDDTSVEIQITQYPVGSKIKTKKWVNIADVGFGVSQVLPVIVALLTAEKGQIVYIEQPEIHLHPRAQFNLSKNLVEAAKRGVKVIVETHSDLLLLGIQTWALKLDLSRNDIAFYWFKRDEFGCTNITKSILNDDGSFSEEWPQDFSDVYLNAQSNFFTASTAHSSKKPSKRLT